MGLHGEFQLQLYPFLVQSVVECENQISKLTSIYYHLLQAKVLVRLINICFHLEYHKFPFEGVLWLFRTAAG